MKRIYLGLFLMSGLAINATAQNAELESLIDMDANTCLNNGQTIQSDTTLSPFGVWGVLNNGPQSLLAGDELNFIYPQSRLSTTNPGSVGVFSYTLPADVPADEFAFVSSNLMVDSINTLLDIDAFENGGTSFSDILVPRAELVANQTYGFYFYTIGTGTDPNNPENTDTDLTNNFVYVAVKWNCGVSIKEMIEGAAKEPIKVFPNPTSTEINFDYTFVTASNAVARITDLTGRTVLVKDFGRNTFGSKRFKINVAELPAGSYILELSTDDKRAISKFNIQK